MDPLRTARRHRAEIDDPASFDAQLIRTGSLAGMVVQGLDLTDHTAVLVDADLTDAVFLGCTVDAPVLRRIAECGALFFPRFPGLPFHAFRSALYTADELFDGYVVGRPETYDTTLDATVYAWTTAARRDVVELLAQRIHDHAIDDALDDLLDGSGLRADVVAVMGGHGLGRDEPAYRDVALLTRSLTRAGRLCASGGGPGAMEACNLGAWFADRSVAELDEALTVLSTSPSFEPVPDWLDTALTVRRGWPLAPGATGSLGVPTWHYGHEPPNVFATHIAKYFANSIREDGLLAIALGGVVFAPGSAGTIQEVFQDAAQNHYESFGVVSPMVFLGSEFWTRTKPVFPLLAQLAQGHAYADAVTVVDSPDDAVAFIDAWADRRR